jgi:hypothetical protein
MSESSQPRGAPHRRDARDYPHNAGAPEAVNENGARRRRDRRSTD